MSHYCESFTQDVDDVEAELCGRLGGDPGIAALREACAEIVKLRDALRRALSFGWGVSGRHDTRGLAEIEIARDAADVLVNGE